MTISTKRRRRGPRTRFLHVDGELHLVVARRPNGLETRKLGPSDQQLVEGALNDTQADLEARILGFRRRRRTR